MAPGKDGNRSAKRTAEVGEALPNDLPNKTSRQSVIDAVRERQTGGNTLTKKMQREGGDKSEPNSGGNHTDTTDGMHALKQRSNSSLPPEPTTAWGDPDEEREGQYPSGPLRNQARRLEKNRRFRMVVLFLVVTNMLYVFLETELSACSLDVATSSRAFWVGFWVDLFFFLVFAMETGVRLYGSGRAFWQSCNPESIFNRLDIFLLLLALADILLGLATGSTCDHASFASVLRTIRIAHVLRVLRVLRFCKELWLLVSGVLDAGKPVGWAWVLILMIIYVFGVFMTRWMGFRYSDEDPVIHEHFRALGWSMLSMFEVLTTEEWPTMARSSMDHVPWIWIIFVVFLCLTHFGLLNVLTAVIIEGTVDQAMQNTSEKMKKMEAERARRIERIDMVFRAADQDGDNNLTKQEFTESLKRPDVIRALHDVDIDFNHAETLFDILDYDGSGSIDMTEFKKGCLRACGEAKAKDVLAVQCDLWRTQMKVTQMIEATMCKWKQRFDRLDAEFEQLRYLLGHDEQTDAIRAQKAPGVKVSLNRFQKATRRLQMLPAGFGKGAPAPQPTGVGENRHPLLNTLGSFMEPRQSTPKSPRRAKTSQVCPETFTTPEG